MQEVRIYCMIKMIGLVICMLMTSMHIFAQDNNATNIATSDVIDLKNLDGDQLKKLIKQANKGDADAQNVVGNYYLNQYPEKNALQKAVEYLREAAQQNHPAAQHNLFIIYQEPQLHLVNHDSALYWLRRSAYNGYAQAQNNLAIYFLQGKNVPQNVDSGFYFMQKAAAQNNPSSLYQLGVLYLIGAGTTIDSTKGLEYVSKAAMLENIDAIELLANVYDGDKYAPFFTWLQKAASMNNVAGMKKLGVVYMQGMGVPQDFEKAAEWLHKATDSNDIYAMFLLANLYHSGKTPNKSLKDAVELWRACAALNGSACYSNLGVLYQKGFPDFPKNVDSAVYFFEQAIALGDVVSKIYLSMIYMDEFSTYFNSEKAKSLLLDAYYAKHELSYYQLSQWYRIYGTTDVDEKTYVKLLMEAANLGQAQAQYELGYHYYNGNYFSQNKNEGILWMKKAAAQQLPQAVQYLKEQNIH